METQADEYPRLGPTECQLGYPFEIGRAKTKHWQRKPSVAFDGRRTYLVVWEEGSKNGDIYAMRLDVEGNLIDSKPLSICQERSRQRDPLVAFGGGLFLVVWSDFRSGRDYDLYGSRITPEGKILDRNGFSISKGIGNRVWPAVAGNGELFIVAWSDFRNGIDYDLYLAQVHTEGVVESTDEVLVSGKSRGYGGANLIHEIMPSLTWDKEKFWLNWLESIHGPGYRKKKRSAHLLTFDALSIKLIAKKETRVDTGRWSVAPLPAIYAFPGKTPSFLVSQVRYHYRKSVSYLAVTYIDFKKMTFRHFPTYSPHKTEKIHWFELFNFKPRSSALNKWYFEDTLTGPLSYAYLMAPEVHWKRWTASRGPDHLFVVTEFTKDLKQGLRGWVLKEGLDISPLASPGFTVEEAFIIGSPAIAADHKGRALLVYEADRGVDDCVIMGRIIQTSHRAIKSLAGLETEALGSH
ncbi:MAG: hypothetical protein SV375_11055 [Thermodesulfobacteriota bacterium]|nr:hypothetical protein [Thermodesulfobacteriota bacterium]